MAFDQPFELSNIPDFTRTFHTITQPEADKSKGLLLQTAATGLEEGVKTADTFFKNRIEGQVQESVSKYRDPFIADLSELRNAMYGGGGADQSLIPPEQRPDTPPQLQNDISRIQQLGAAIGAGGHANDTLYWGKMFAEAKRIRNANPGYTNEVDDAFKQATGRDPANAFMSNLLEDINRGMAGKDKELDATRAQLRSLGAQGFHDGAGVMASDMLKKLDAGQISHLDAEDWINRTQSTDFNISQTARKLLDKQNKGQDVLIDAKQGLSSMAGQIADNNWKTMHVGAGVSTGAELARALEESAGQGMSEEKARSAGEQMAAIRNITFNQIRKKAIEQGYLKLFGGDAQLMDQWINNSLGYMDLAVQATYNKDHGPAASHMNRNAAIHNDTTNMLYNVPDEGSTKGLAKYNRMLETLKGYPEFASAFFKNFLADPDMPDREREWLKGKEMEILTQPFSAPKAVQQQIQEGQQRGAVSPKTYDHMINTVNTIADPKAPEKLKVNAARAFFDPTLNEGLLSDDNFKRDSVDAKGRQVPGKYSVWNRMSSEGVANGMKELMKTHPEFRQWYPMMMEKEFGEQLWGRELKDMGPLNAVGRMGAWTIKFSHGAGADQPPRFDVLTYKGQPVNPKYSIGLLGTSLEGTKNRLNLAISGLWNVYKATGEKDPTAHILETMHKYGLSSGIASDLFNTATKASVEEMANPPEPPVSGGEK